MNNLINSQNLKDWLACSQLKKVIRFLNKHKIPYWIEKGQPVTTIEAINEKLLHESNNEEEKIEF